MAPDSCPNHGLSLNAILGLSRLRDAWKHDAGDFTPWLAEAGNLDALAQALGLSELEVVTTEQFYRSLGLRHRHHRQYP